LYFFIFVHVFFLHVCAMVLYSSWENYQYFLHIVQGVFSLKSY